MSYKIHTNIPYDQTLRELKEQFRMWGVDKDDWDLFPMTKSDTGGLTLTFTVKNRPVRIDMDTQDDRKNNIRVLFLAVEAMRLNEKRGIDQAVAKAYAQLGSGDPSQVYQMPDEDPYRVLGVLEDSPLEVIEASYRALARKAHPDQGGSVAAMARLNRAIEAIKRERDNHDQ